MVGCSAFAGKTFEQFTMDQYVVAYGYRSGKRLAMLSQAGLAHE